MPHKNENGFWIALTDARRARLIRLHLRDDGNWAGEEVGEIINSFEQDHERHRPDMLGRSPAGGFSTANTGREVDEQHRRFAAQIAEWLLNEHRKGQFARLELFASPRFLGTLREKLPHQLRSIIEDHDKDLSMLSMNDVITHPEVARLLQPVPK